MSTERTYLIATKEWEGYTLHGTVTGPVDADVLALWRCFRREFGLLKLLAGERAALEAAGYSGTAQEAFVAWLTQTQGFRSAESDLVSLTEEFMEDDPIHRKGTNERRRVGVV